jgi:hypothetical protein
MTQKFQGASGQSNKILPQCSGVPRYPDPKSNKILPITRTSSCSFPWAVKNSQAQSHAQAQAEDTGASTGTPVIIYDESRLTAAGVRSAHKVIIYDESWLMPAAYLEVHKVIIYDESRSGAAGPGELQGNNL